GRVGRVAGSGADAYRRVATRPERCLSRTIVPLRLPRAARVSRDVLSQMDIPLDVPRTRSVTPGCRDRLASTARLLPRELLAWQPLKHRIVRAPDLVDVVRRTPRLDHMHVDMLGDRGVGIVSGANRLKCVAPLGVGQRPPAKKAMAVGVIAAWWIGLGVNALRVGVVGIDDDAA